MERRLTSSRFIYLFYFRLFSLFFEIVLLAVNFSQHLMTKWVLCSRCAPDNHPLCCAYVTTFRCSMCITFVTSHLFYLTRLGALFYINLDFPVSSSSLFFKLTWNFSRATDAYSNIILAKEKIKTFQPIEFHIVIILHLFLALSLSLCIKLIAKCKTCFKIIEFLLHYLWRAENQLSIL